MPGLQNHRRIPPLAGIVLAVALAVYLVRGDAAFPVLLGAAAGLALVLLLLGQQARLGAARRLESELRARAEHLRTLVNAIPDQVWMNDSAGVCVDANPVVERFLGKAPGTLIGTTDGGQAWLETTRIAVRDDQGRPLGVCSGCVITRQSGLPAGV